MSTKQQFGSSSLILLMLAFLCYSATADLQLNYYSKSCPKAQQIIKEQVYKLYKKHGNTAVSWIRTLFHDCVVKSCDASVLLQSAKGITSELTSNLNFGMRNLKYIDVIKAALEAECPNTVSCADIIALSASEGSPLLYGPIMEMKTGRRDGRVSFVAEIGKYIPSHNASIPFILSLFKSVGVDTEGAVALIGAHSVGRVHCVNIVDRLYPEVDKTLDPAYAIYLKGRCPSPTPDPVAVEYARNDRVTTMVLDNMYYKNILAHKGLLVVDQELVTDPATAPYVIKMAADNSYFHDQFARAMVILSENNPLTGNQGEIRKDCRFVNPL